MLKTKIKRALADMRPCAERLAFDTARGYVFGCLLGVFVPSKKPLGCSMHENGKNFARMSAAYSITDMALSRVRNKNDAYCSMAAGAVAGSVGSQHGRAAGMCFLGAYSGLMHHFSKQ